MHVIFLDEKADIVVRSFDDVSLPIRRAHLEAAFEVFEDTFLTCGLEGAQECDTKDWPSWTFLEETNVLRLLLQLIHPRL